MHGTHACAHLLVEQLNVLIGARLADALATTAPARLHVHCPLHHEHSLILLVSPEPQCGLVSSGTPSDSTAERYPKPPEIIFLRPKPLSRTLSMTGYPISRQLASASSRLCTHADWYACSGMVTSSAEWCTVETPEPLHGSVGTPAACARMLDAILSPSAAMALSRGPRKIIPSSVSSRGSSGFSDAWPLHAALWSLLYVTSCMCKLVGSCASALSAAAASECHSGDCVACTRLNKWHLYQLCGNCVVLNTLVQISEVEQWTAVDTSGRWVPCSPCCIRH